MWESSRYEENLIISSIVNEKTFKINRNLVTQFGTVRYNKRARDEERKQERTRS